MDKLKRYKGITLISLVVTIVILIILTGISINMILSNNGLLNKTSQAKEEYQKQTATEIMNLKITNIQISSYTESQELPNLQYVSDKLCEDNDMEYVVLKEKEQASLEKITVGSTDSILTKLKEYPYEFEINNQLQLASIDGVKVATQNNDYSTLQEEIESLKTRVKELEDLSLDDRISIIETSKLNESNWTSLVDGCVYKKKNGYVTVMLTGSDKISIAANTATWTYTIGTLPEGYRPSRVIFDNVSYGSYNSSSGCIVINTDGKIYLCGQNAGTYITTSVTFPVD